MSLRDIRLSSFRTNRVPASSLDSHNGGSSIYSEDASVLLDDNSNLSNNLAGDLDIQGTNDGTATAAMEDAIFTENGELTMSSKFCVKKLPATPNVLRRSRSQRQIRTSVDVDRAVQGQFDENTGYALIQTSSNIYVWSYKDPSRVPDCFTFSLANKQVGGLDMDLDEIEESDSDVEYEALSYLVAPGPGSKYPGLVSIDQNTGIVTYWEDVGRAGASDLLNHRKGHSAQIKVQQNDKITVGAVLEPAGIAVGLASGRQLLVTLRDMQGRVNLQVHALNGPSGDGLFASLKGLITLQGHGGSADLVSVIGGPETGRTERIAVFLGSKGHLSAYECSRSGHARRLVDVNLSAMMVNEIAGVYSSADESLFLHDAVVTTDKIFILASVETDNRSSVAYIIYTFNIGSNFSHDPELQSTYRLLAYGEPFSEYQCQLYKSQSSNQNVSSITLFAVFQDAIVMLDATSLNGPMDSKGVVGRRWEAPVTMKRGLDIIGAVSQSRSYGMLAMVRNFGVIEVERFVEDNKLATLTDQEAEVDLLKSLLEQAVFYGARSESTGIIFDRRNELSFSSEEVNKCFRALSSEILESRSRWMATSLPSTTDFLTSKVTYLTKLAEYASANFEQQLSRESKLELIMDMQRAAAAGGLWSVVGSYRTKSDQNDENIKDFVDSMETALREMPRNIESNILKATKFRNDPECLIQSLSNGAFLLGAEGSRLYNVTKLDVSRSVNPWTSKPELVDACENMYQQLLSQSQTKELIRTVNLLCGMYSQRTIWLKQTGYEADFVAFNRRYCEHRIEWIRKIVRAGHVEDALLIAEEFELFRAIAEVIIEKWQAANVAKDERDLVRCELRINQNMKRFGYPFSEAFYGYLAESGRIKMLMTEFTEHQEFLDRYLVENRLNKLAWIRQVENQQYQKASECLLEDADSSGVAASCARRQFELSVAKLAALASQNCDTVLQPRIARMSQSIDAKLLSLQFQQSLETQIEREDDSSHLVALREDGGYPGLSKLTHQLISKTQKHRILNVDELIDLLTLIDTTSPDSRLNFYRALKLALMHNRRRLRVIWRRLFLRDDWSYMAEFSQDKSDEDKKAMCHKTILYQTLQALNAHNEQLDQESLAICRNPLILGQLLVVEEETESSMIRKRYEWVDETTLAQITSDLSKEAQSASETFLVQWVKSVIAQAEHDMQQ